MLESLRCLRKIACTSLLTVNVFKASSCCILCVTLNGDVSCPYALVGFAVLVSQALTLSLLKCSWGQCVLFGSCILVFPALR